MLHVEFLGASYTKCTHSYNTQMHYWCSIKQTAAGFYSVKSNEITACTEGLSVDYYCVSAQGQTTIVTVQMILVYCVSVHFM